MCICISAIPHLSVVFTDRLELLFIYVDQFPIPQVFFISRIVIFPFFIIRTTMFSMLSYMHPYMTVSEVLSSGVGFPAPWWLYNGLLSTLMCLHMFWFR